MDVVGETVEDESGKYEENMKQLQGVFPTVSEGNLRKFLGFKDDVDRAISCLRGHIQFRTENAWIDNPPLRAGEDPLLKKMLEEEIILQPDGSYDKQGRAILWVCFRNNDMRDGRSPESVIRMAFYNMERLLMKPAAVENGVIIVYDLQGLARHNLNIRIPRLIMPALSGGKMPMRVKGFNFVNPPVIFKGFLSVVKMLLSKKLRKRIRIWKSMDELEEIIDRENFPQAYGGALEHDQKLWVEQEISSEQNRGPSSEPLLEELVAVQC